LNFFGRDRVAPESRNALPIAWPFFQGAREGRCGMTKAERQKTAEKICSGVSADLKPMAVTLANAVLAMQKKIEEQIPVYSKNPLTQELLTTQGEKAIKNNPIMQEFRAHVRDYGASLRDLKSLVSEGKEPAQLSDMAQLRKKFKIAK
jgi:hypothetical protein